AVDVDFRASLDDLGHAGLDDDTLAEVVPVGLDGCPLEAEQKDPFSRVEPIDDDLDGGAWLGGLAALELIERDDPLTLAPQVDEDVLTAHGNDLAGAGAGSSFVPPFAPRVRSAFGPRGAGRDHLEALRVEPTQGGLELRLHLGIPLPFQGDVSPPWLAGS